MPLVEAFSSTLTAMCNVGPALGSVGPANHFADLPDQAKLIMATLMIVGRLEFFTALAVLTPNFWSGR